MLGANDANQLLSSAEDSVLQCSVHRDKSAQLHCSSCSQLLCNECLALHTWHELETIADAVQRYRKELNWCTDKLNERTTYYSDCKKRTDSMSANLNEIEGEIVKKAEEMKRLIEEHTRVLLDKLESIRNANNSSTASINSTAFTSLVKTLNFTKELVDMGSDRDLMSFSKYLIDRVNSHLLSGTGNLPVLIKYKFEAQVDMRHKGNVVGAIGEYFYTCHIYGQTDS